MKLIQKETKSPSLGLWDKWRSVITHSHMIRSHNVPFEQAKKNLIEWCSKNNIDAAGVGSPWEPVSTAHYAHYEGVERDLYYSGRIDPQDVMDCEEIAELFRSLNEASGGKTLFFQDNETPKGRMGHMWYFGYHYDVPAWHDYSQDKPVQYYDADPYGDINSITGKPHRRRPPIEIVDYQRGAGSVPVWAHPTSWWWGGEDDFVTNIAAPISMQLLVDGRLDGITVAGYDVYHRHYQGLWFHFLDTGAIVPGFAEMDGCFDSSALKDQAKIFKNFLHINGAFTADSMVEAARSGRCFAGTGAYLTIAVDDVPMGGILRTSSGQQHRLRIEAYPPGGQKFFSRVDVIGHGGEVLASETGFSGGVLEYEISSNREHNYVVARAFGEHDNPDLQCQQDVVHMAITNPVYLQVEGFSFKPIRTHCKITVSDGSQWLGGTLQFQQADGTMITKHEIRPGCIEETVPGSARIHLEKDGLEDRYFYIAMENEEAERHLRYLHDGEFLKDFPGLHPGEVPAEAFHLEEMRKALQRFAYTL